MESPDALSIGYEICDQSRDIVQLLVIGYRANGSPFSLDTGLTVDKAKEMCQQFVAWMDQCIGREIERASKSEG